MEKLFRLLQLADSTFPVGSFSFSNGLETAAHLGFIHDRQSLCEYAKSVAGQAAQCDAVAALLAFRAASDGDYGRILETDRRFMLFKMNSEARLMLARMGKKFAELACHLFEGRGFFSRWLGDIAEGKTPGSYPVAQGMAFALEGQDEKSLFTAHQYAAINMILSAALRCVRVSHYDTQSILYELGGEIEAQYEKARRLDFDTMNSFVPEIDILASLHEKGSMRMFMN